MTLTRRDALQRGLLAAPVLFGASACETCLLPAQNQVVVPPIRWSAEKKVSDSFTFVGSDLVTAHAPSLTAEGSTMYLAHAGDGGSTLWLAPPMTAPLNFSKGSQSRPFVSDQVKPFGKAAKIHGAPVCVRFGGYTAILAADEDQHGVTCYFYDGNNWASTPVFRESGSTFSPPKAIAVGEVLDVFSTVDGMQRHAYCVGRIFDRSAWKITATSSAAVQVDSLAASGLRVLAVCRAGASGAGRSLATYSPSYGQPTMQPPYRRIVLSGNSPAMNDDGAVVFVHGENVGYVYRGANSGQLYYAWAEPGSNSPGSSVVLQPSVPLQGKSSELPGVAVVGDSVYLAYKGQSTHDMYMLRGDM